MYPKLLVSDIHAHERPPRTRIDELELLIRKLRIVMIKKKCKSMVVLGDLFDKNAPVSIQHLLRLGELFKIPKRVDLIVGNHDTPIKGSGFSLLDIFGLGVANVISKPTVINQCLFLPYYTRDIPPGPFKFAFMHKDIKELNPYFDADWAITLDELPDAPITFNGHLHKNGEITHSKPRKKLIQLGSPYPTTWSDAYQDNRYVYVVYANGTYERIALNITADEGAPDANEYARVRTREEKKQAEAIDATAILDKVRGEIISVDKCLDMIDTDPIIKKIAKGVISNVEAAEIDGEKL